MTPSERAWAAACVIAGGRSTRMGQDKASLVLGGASLLVRAVTQLAVVSRQVFVAGDRVSAPPGAVALRDALPDCGPMGGMAAALRAATALDAGWVVFQPVDMPLLPAGLLHALMENWRAAAEGGAWVCCADADGRMQPLVSAVSTAVLPALEEALRAGEYRVRPVLEAAAKALAEMRGTDPEMAFYRTRVEEERLPGGWRPSEAEWRRRALWFSNVNTPEDLAIATEALMSMQVEATRMGE